MWYVLQVAAGSEDSLVPIIGRALHVVDEYCDVFVPHFLGFRKDKEIWRNDERRVLFPGSGYVFVDTDRPELVEKRLHIFTNQVKPVSIEGGFHPIHMEEQEYLQKWMDAHHDIAISTGELIDGTLVVYHGPLRGRTKFVRRIDKHKRSAEVDCTLWGQKQLMRVGLELQWKNLREESARQPVA